MKRWSEIPPGMRSIVRQLLDSFVRAHTEVEQRAGLPWPMLETWQAVRVELFDPKLYETPDCAHEATNRFGQSGASVEVCCRCRAVRFDDATVWLGGRVSAAGAPIPMLLHCPECHARHIDVGDFATKVHHTHACQSCGLTWRPAIVPTVGVQFLPGFKNEEPPLAFQQAFECTMCRMWVTLAKEGDTHIDCPRKPRGCWGRIEVTGGAKVFKDPGKLKAPSEADRLCVFCGHGAELHLHGLHCFHGDESGTCSCPSFLFPEGGV